jgi:hypothetical protein
MDDAPDIADQHIVAGEEIARLLQNRNTHQERASAAMRASTSARRGQAAPPRHSPVDRAAATLA